MSETPQDLNKAIFKVTLAARSEGEMSVEVVNLPAHQNGGELITAQGDRVKVGSFLKVECLVGSPSEVLIRVYASIESDVEAAITLAWTEARSKTAEALEDAKACFTAAHSKPRIVRSVWSADQAG